MRRLRAAGCVWAEQEAGELRAAATDPEHLERLVAARLAGAPLEQVVGSAGFDGLRVALRPGVFVPRQRTLLVVREAAARLRAGAVAVDLCCGSGAVALALARRVPGLELHAADLDPDAVACARGNLAGLASVHEGDLLAALPHRLRGRVDVLAVNAPYVPSDELALLPPEARLHEPRAALDGGADGLDVHRRVAAAAPGWLAPGGALVLETSRRQAPGTAAAVAAAGLAVEVVEDPALGATAVVGTVVPSGQRR